MDGETWLVDGEASVVMMAVISSNSLSRRSARTEFLVPETEFRDVAAFWRVSGDFDFVPRVFRSKPLSSPEGGVGGQPRGPHNRAARPPPGPRRLSVWGPRASTWLALLAPSIFWKNKTFGINSENFPERWISAKNETPEQFC